MAVELQPSFEDARIGLARTLIELNQPGKALPHLQAALRLNNENEVSHYQLARVYQALGRASEQQQELQEFRRLRAQKQSRQKSLVEAPFTLADVTKQSVDSDTP